MGIRSGEETRLYEKDRTEVMDALAKAMEALKIKIEEKDDDAGRISGVHGLNFFSAGTALTAQVEERDDKLAVTVRGESRSKLTLIDYGQSSRDVKNILNKMEEILGSAGEKLTAPAPEKKAPAQGKRCPSCNKPVAGGAKFCTGCGAKLNGSGK